MHAPEDGDLPGGDLTPHKGLGEKVVDVVELRFLVYTRHAVAPHDIIYLLFL